MASKDETYIIIALQGSPADAVANCSIALSKAGLPINWAYLYDGDMDEIIGLRNLRSRQLRHKQLEAIEKIAIQLLYSVRGAHLNHKTRELFDSLNTTLNKWEG